MQSLRLPPLDSSDILACHDRALATGRWHEAREGPESGVWYWIERNHRCNAELWDEEDRARRTDVPDAEIAACKRRIDRLNQQRNDAVEQVDEQLLALLPPGGPAGNARQHSETAGAMIDRLSILALKIHHMDLQARRDDASAEHRAACRAKCAVLRQQRDDLARCLDGLLAEAARGDAFFKPYRQYKMYNDPALNP